MPKMFESVHDLVRVVEEIRDQDDQAAAVQAFRHVVQRLTDVGLVRMLDTLETAENFCELCAHRARRELLMDGTRYRTSVDYQLFTDGSWRVQRFLEAPRGTERVSDGFCG